MGKQLEIDSCTDCKHFGRGTVSCYYFEDTNPIYEEEIGEHIFKIENPETIPKECPLPPYQIDNIVCDMNRELPDYYAEIEILEVIKNLKDTGAKDFSILDIILKTNFPPEQINRILEKIKLKRKNEN